MAGTSHSIARRQQHLQHAPAALAEALLAAAVMVMTHIYPPRLPRESSLVLFFDHYYRRHLSDASKQRFTSKSEVH